MLRRLIIAPAAIVTIVAAALLLLMTPPWMHLALDVSGGSRALPTPAQAHALSDRTVLELFAGPGTFASFRADEAAHMRDVRAVLLGFLVAAAIAALFLVWSLWRGRRDAETWRALSRAGALIVVGVVVVGLLGALAFGLAFELFHRILFPGGNWSFPASSLLVRLYPLAFWQLSAAALGVLVALGGAAAWTVGRRRAHALAARESR